MPAPPITNTFIKSPVNKDLDPDYDNVAHNDEPNVPTVVPAPAEVPVVAEEVPSVAKEVSTELPVVAASPAPAPARVGMLTRPYVPKLVQTQVKAQVQTLVKAETVPKKQGNANGIMWGLGGLIAGFILASGQQSG